MRKLDIEQVKSVMRDHRNDLVFCPVDEHWFISNQESKLEQVHVDKVVADTITLWSAEKAIHCAFWDAKSLQNSATKGKIYFDAWRSEQAYGQQPHPGYLKATEYGIQRNNEHYDDEVEVMDDEVLQMQAEMLCLDCAKVSHYTEKRNTAEEECDCGGQFSSGQWENHAIAQLRAGKRLKTDTGLSVDIPEHWTEKDGCKLEKH